MATNDRQISPATQDRRLMTEQKWRQILDEQPRIGLKLKSVHRGGGRGGEFTRFAEGGTLRTWPGFASQTPVILKNLHNLH